MWLPENLALVNMSLLPCLGPGSRYTVYCALTDGTVLRSIYPLKMKFTNSSKSAVLHTFAVLIQKKYNKNTNSRRQHYYTCEDAPAFIYHEGLGEHS